ncbi:hypothetical protein FAZ95_07005 [Trinickia violacea]|uniref:Uncharacterized protein n=1 Tax=Trinickia violacea TaxID=2571746 RepID=A0A4P8IPL1_9BURK|nr:hypothetical protein [Trinickia violacea]QCP48953.1 hypothetical protein FAZ95_07005 [Trinickia violacea]
MEAKQNRASDRPETNPSPQKALLVQGTKAPGMEIWLDVGYATTNEACRSQTLFARILGAPDVIQVVYDSVRVPEEDTKFAFKLSLDRYLPGECGWKPFVLRFAKFEPGVTSGPLFTTPIAVIRDNGKENAEYTWVCHREQKYHDLEKTPWLACRSPRRISNEDMTISSNGAVVEIHLAIDTESSEP